MEIGYSNIANNQTATKNTSSDSIVQAGKAQSQITDISSLSAGKIFKGEILNIKGSQVSIGLENGQVLNAKMEADVDLAVGQKLMFEVKTNTGVHIEIKPAEVSMNPNPVLQKALQEANFPITDRNMEMVSNMIKEGLSIDKQSLSVMLRQFSINPDTDASIIVKMNKLGIDTTKENIEQFENYKNYEHRIVKGIDNIANHITQLLGEMAAENKNSSILLYNKIVDMLNNNNTADSKVTNPKQAIEVPLNQNTLGQTDENQIVANEGKEQNHTLNKPLADSILQEPLLDNTKILQSALEGDSINVKGDNINQLNETMKSTLINDIVYKDNSIQSDKNENTYRNEMNTLKSNQTDLIKDTLEENDIGNNKSLAKNQIGNQGQLLENILTNEERSNLAQKLQNLGADSFLLNQVKEGKIDSKELLNIVKTLLSNTNDVIEPKSLFNSKEYMEILKQVIKNQWLVEPDDLKEPDKMTKLYKQMDEQTKQISTMLENLGKENSGLFKEVSNMKSNLSFMEQINQNFTYIQIPVQFSNEEAHSDLYVYTNKKNLKNNDGNLSVLLHLDMEVLGTTDVYIKMSGNHVNAKFSFENNEAIEIVESNLENLIKRLQNKGYSASAQVGHLEKEQDFVEDFLEKDKITTSLKRYAFDVRT